MGKNMSNDTLIIRKEIENLKAKEFCKEFEKGNRPRFIFGRNEFAESLIK